jgi:hypothetical protein
MEAALPDPVALLPGWQAKKAFMISYERAANLLAESGQRIGDESDQFRETGAV